MKRQNHKVIVWLRVCVLAMFCPAFLWRCATVMTLGGGPIDALPPVIVSMLPANFTANFHVAPNEEKTPAFDPGPGHPDPDQGYAQGEHDLRAEFRQCRARQQRG